MSGTSLVTAIIEILVSGITGVATGVGQGLSTLASNIFFVTVEGTTSLSVLGICIVAFAGISLALSLCRLILPGDIKLMEKHERFNTNVNGSYIVKVCNTCNA